MGCSLAAHAAVLVLVVGLLGFGLVGRLGLLFGLLLGLIFLDGVVSENG